jgi:spore germination cell wall hydrolase CwlJ-like protein
MVRAGVRPGGWNRPQRPTLLFRLIFAGAFLALSSTGISQSEHAPQSQAETAAADLGVDPLTTGGIAAPAMVMLKQAIKGDRLNHAHLMTQAFNAGAVEAPAFFSPVVSGMNATFALPKPIAVSAAVDLPPRPGAAVTRPIPAVAAAKLPLAPTATPAPVLLAYAPAKDLGAETAPFDAVIAKDKPMSAILVPNVDFNHAWVNDPLPASVHSEGEITCLATAIYFEARGEPQLGQLAVAQVVLNRVKNPAYPNTICGVVYQNKNMRHRCQFSFACDGIRDRVTDEGSWTQALALARKVVGDETDMFLADVGTSTHYHAVYVRPRWARSMKKMDKIGRHIFYKTYGGGWS